MKRPRFVQVETNRHGKRIVYFRKGAGACRIRLPDLECSDFASAYQAALAGKPVPHVRDMPVTKIEQRKQRVERAMQRCIQSARQRSASRNLHFDLSLDWALIQAEAQDFRCALTGIEFYAEHESLSFQNPYAPSFDRIEPHQGYVQSNVRIVTFAVNMMLSDWGTEVFERVANSYRYTQRKRVNPPHRLPDNPAPDKKAI